MLQKKVPMRKCIGCLESKPKKELLRVTVSNGGIAADLSGKSPGRGAYLCLDLKCLAKAVKKNAFQRNLGTALSDEAGKALATEIERIAETNKKPEVQ